MLFFSKSTDCSQQQVSNLSDGEAGTTSGRKMERSPQTQGA
jgi:hypothetical protein